MSPKLPSVRAGLKMGICKKVIYFILSNIGPGIIIVQITFHPSKCNFERGWIIGCIKFTILSRERLGWLQNLDIVSTDIVTSANLPYSLKPSNISIVDY